MRKGVRIFGWVSLVLGFIALLVVLLFLYRNHRANQQLIPQTAEAILEVKADEIFRQLLGNAIANPTSYFAGKKDSAKDDRFEDLRPWNLGVDLPAKFYFFQIPQAPSSYLCFLKIDDLTRLKALLTDRMQLTWNDEGNNWSATNEDQKLVFAGNAEHAVLAWSSKKDNSNPSLIFELLDKTENMVPISDFLDSIPSNDRGQITYWQPHTANHWSISLKVGKASLEGVWSNDSWQFPEKTNAPALDNEAILSVALHADIRNWLAQHPEWLPSQDITWSEVSPYIGNYFEMQWKAGTVMQSDTVVTYDYDDNFEMVEKQELREEAVPNLTLSLMASPHLLTYLPEKMFYKFNRGQNGQLLELSTSPTSLKTPRPFVENDAHFVLKYREPNLSEQQHLPIPTWLQIYRSVDITGESTKAHTIRISGEMLTANQNLHPIKQLADQLSSKNN
ncbi:hypothetical protein ACFSQ3_07945 [Sphingobacterium corticis]|uniref:DUF4340 domain-containing protein n=1 Tax=Sphingobacterium corticis TaxID=1812823 RepID=A0ABW5NLR5_9SPHI